MNSTISKGWEDCFAMVIDNLVVAWVYWHPDDQLLDRRGAVSSSVRGWADA